MRKYEEWTEDEKQEWNRYYLNSDNAYQDEIANKVIEIASRKPKEKIERMAIGEWISGISAIEKMNELVDAVNELREKNNV